jgi:hypothetical protein
MGFGVVELTPRQDTRAFHEHLQAISGARAEGGLPSLRNLFFARVRANGAAPNENFNLKYDLRRLFAADARLRHRVMGSARGDREGAKVAISRPYDGGKLRIWGWIPEATGSATSRDQVVQAIHAHLRGAYTIDYWREFNSMRDTTGRYNDPGEFLGSLLVQP